MRNTSPPLRNQRLAVARAAVAREGRPVTLADVPAPPGTRSRTHGYRLRLPHGGVEAQRRRPADGARPIPRSSPSTIACCPAGTMRDVPGSPYCIQAYEPDARMGGWTGLDAARAELAARGMSLDPRLRAEPHRVRPRLDPHATPSSSSRARSTTTAPSRSCTIRSRMPTATPCASSPAGAIRSFRRGATSRS